MFRWSLIFLGLAVGIGVIGLSGFANISWVDVSTAFYIVLLLPVFALVTKGLKKSFAPDTMIAFRTVLFMMMAVSLLAFLL